MDQVLKYEKWMNNISGLLNSLQRSIEIWMNKPFISDLLNSLQRSIEIWMNNIISFKEVLKYG